MDELNPIIRVLQLGRTKMISVLDVPSLKNDADGRMDRPSDLVIDRMSGAQTPHTGSACGADLASSVRIPLRYATFRFPPKLEVIMKRDARQCVEVTAKLRQRPGHLRSLQLAIFLLALGSVGCASNRVMDGPPLQLHRSKFTYNSPAKQPVYDWFSLDPAFEAVLERHPSALAEARKGNPFRTGVWLAGVGYGAFMVKSMLAINDVDVDEGLSSSGYESIKGDLAIAVGFAVGVGVFDAIARRHLSRSVSLFNAEEMRRSEQQADGPDLFGRIQFSPYVPGNGAGLVARIPLR